VNSHARGAFDVKTIPQPADEEGVAIGRLLLDKQFHGDLEATSKGQMLAVRTGVANSAGYVAMEQVTGTLLGRTGSFALQHSGTMNRGEQELLITVVPDSGTAELAGLMGTMMIIIEGGKHSYDFESSLDD
jgi:hypothetical protein